MATVITKTIKPAGGGDYTTLAAANSARARDLVSADETEVWVLSGGNAGACGIDSPWVLNSSHRLKITADALARHGGVYDVNCATISQVLIGNSPSLPYVDFMGLCVNVIGSNYGVYNAYSAGDVTVEGCIAKGTGASFSYSAFVRVRRVTNTVAYACNSLCSALSYATTTIQNCTAVNCSYAIYGNNSYLPIVKNCISQNCSSGFYRCSNASSDYNVSDISGNAPGAHSVTGTVQFKDAANNDYHLAATDTVARGAGANLTASGITTDIDGETRPATGAWDIGADQYVSPAPTGPWGTPKFGISQPFGAQKFGVTPWM